ncbi:PAS domain-containing protein [Halanaerobaculum tunisiense]
MRVTSFAGKGSHSVVMSHENITTRKLAEQTLKKSEEKFRKSVENANDIIYTLSSDGIFIYASPIKADLIGDDPANVVGKSFKTFVHPERDTSKT